MDEKLALINSINVNGLGWKHCISVCQMLIELKVCYSPNGGIATTQTLWYTVAGFLRLEAAT